MAVMKYRDPETGEIKKIGAPVTDSYTKAQVDAKMTELDNKIAAKAPAYSCGTTDLTPGVSALETGKLYFVYE